MALDPGRGMVVAGAGSGAMAEMVDQTVERSHSLTRVVKAYVIEPDQAAKDEAEQSASRELPEKDFWMDLGNKILPSPYDFAIMLRCIALSSQVPQLIDAMAVNVAGFGLQLVPVVPLDKLQEEQRAEAKAERVRLANFWAYAFTGQRCSTTEGLKRLLRDRESIGNSYMEVVPTLDEKGIAELRQLRSYQMRLALQDETPTEVSDPILVTGVDGIPVYETRTYYRRFRRYVQGFMVGLTFKTRWYKEFGDPRVVDNETGDYATADRVANWDGQGKPMPMMRRASEVIHQAIYWPDSPYGVPRWVGNTTNVLGLRQAEETTFNTMRNNMMPSMAVCVDDGRLSDGSVDRLKQFSNETIKGSTNYSRWVVLESEGNLEGEDSAQKSKIRIEPLADLQRTEGLFKEYGAGAKGSIREAWRMPPIFVGASADYNKATAEEARKMADEQIFDPDRKDLDWLLNNTVMTRLKARYWRVQMHTPNVTDNLELVSMLASAERTGGVTPRIARQVVVDVFPGAAEAPPVEAGGIDPDVPFSLQMADAVKNQAMPTEVNQQVAPVQPGIGKSMSDEADAIVRYLDLGDAASVELRRQMIKRVSGG